MSVAPNKLPTLAVSLGCALVAACAGLQAPTSARGEFAPATLLSGSAQLQFDNANAPALSADGRYAVFQGSIAGNPGIYRRDLADGALELVAGGAAADTEARCEATPAHPFVACDAAAPSVSANGRYVAFTTTADLEPLERLASGAERGEPAADDGCPEVYVRDMQKTPGEPGAYTLASALDGSEEGIAFTQRYGACASRFGFAVAGVQAAPGVALSADGQRVAFTVLSESDLAGLATPPGQVAVRDLETHTTTLVTANANGAPVAGGGAFPDVFSLTKTAAGGGAAVELEALQPSYGDQPAASTAAISADGNAVAWLGMNVAEQVSSAEAQREPQLMSSEIEAEPLWRSVDGDEGGGARRLLAGAGLGFYFTPDPAQPPNPVEAGSLRGTQQMDFVAPALSADGENVAVIATAPPAAAQPSLEALTGLSEFSSDAYLVHVDEEDPSDTPQVRPLTEVSNYDVSQLELGDVKDVAISPDGTRVAFDTSRASLYLPTLAAVGSAAPAGEQVVYEADVARGTLERVTSSYNGAQLNGAVGLLSFDGDGQTLAFASQATNLFYGDAVGAWEVYATGELVAAGTPPTAQQIGAAPGIALPTPEWVLNAIALPAADGSVIVRAQVPGAGRLAVRARAQLSQFAAAHSRSVRSSRAVARAVETSKARGRRGRRGGSASPITPRVVAQSSMLAAAPAELVLRVRVGAAYSRLVAEPHGLYAVLRIAFAAPGHGTLIREVPVTFRLRARAARRGSRTSRGRARGARAAGHTERTQ